MSLFVVVYTNTNNNFFWGDRITTKTQNDYLYKILQTIQSDIEYIKEYIKSQDKDQYALDRCKEILKQQKIITTTTIEKDKILGKRYRFRDTQNRLLNDLLENDEELIEIRAGKGDKRHIFYKKDEQYVNNLISVKKTNESFKRKLSANTNEYDMIKAYFQDYKKPSMSIDQGIRILRREFNVKLERKRKLIFKDLIDDGVIKRFEYNNIILKDINKNIIVRGEEI